MVNPGSPWASLALGFVLSGLVATAALKKASLSPSGALAALVVGTATFGLGGQAWGVVLASFFVSSSALSRLGNNRKRAAVQEQAKGSRRDAWQVIANGGTGALLAVAASLSGAEWAFPAFVGSIAAATADTWATEIGLLDKSQPRLITTGRRASPGASGAVSPLGTLSAVSGSAFIGAVALGMLAVDPTAGARAAPVLVLAGAIASGVVGSLADSLAGATVQARRYCATCHKVTEKIVHSSCGSRTVVTEGISWVTNDVVNFVSVVAGGFVGAGLWFVGLPN